MHLTGKKKDEIPFTPSVSPSSSSLANLGQKCVCVRVPVCVAGKEGSGESVSVNPNKQLFPFKRGLLFISCTPY